MVIGQSPHLNLSGDDVMEAAAGAEEKTAHGVQSFAPAVGWGHVRGGRDDDLATQQGMMGVVLAEQGGEGAVGGAGERQPQMGRDD